MKPIHWAMLAFIIWLLLLGMESVKAHDCSTHLRAACADVNGDGQLNAGDALLLQQFLLGIREDEVVTPALPVVDDVIQQTMYWTKDNLCDTYGFNLFTSFNNGSTYVQIGGVDNIYPASANCAVSSICSYQMDVVQSTRPDAVELKCFYGSDVITGLKYYFNY